MSASKSKPTRHLLPFVVHLWLLGGGIKDLKNPENHR